MRITRKYIVLAFTAVLLAVGITNSTAQTKKNVFQPGEELVYKVKYGFIKLGTLVIQTGGINADGQVSARMQFWTADVPFLNTKSTVTDVLDSHNLWVTRFAEKSQNGDVVKNKQMTYDHAAKTLTYSDDEISNKVTQNVEPFNDVL